MERYQPGILVNGAIGGAIAGVVVVVWFLGIDFVTGDPFDTPARLASIVMGEEFTGPWPRLVVLFTILHFGVFLSLGVATTWFLDSIDVKPGLMVGAIFGVGVLNAVHYAGIMVTGTNLLTVVPVGHVFAANLLGGMLMMAYLHRTLGVESPLGWNVLRQYPVLYDGLITGVVGAATVAIWFLLVDMVTTKPFSTPAALGSAVLLAANGPDEVQFNMGVILAYSFLHITAFLAVGITFAWLAHRVERASGFWGRGVAVLVLLEGLFFGTVEIMSGWVLVELGWWVILIANALAVAAMGGWIVRQHPELRATFLEDTATTES